MVDEHINLSELFLASKRLRFLHLNSEGNLVFKDNVCGKYLPLFLGADVLSKCSISVPNLPRTHAKFAKKGLAAKVNFPSSVRLNGIQGTGRGVWFYSVQGLFRVAFELFSREEQLDLLKRLPTIWTLRLHDPILNDVINITKVNLDDEDKGQTTDKQTFCGVETSFGNMSRKSSETDLVQTTQCGIERSTPQVEIQTALQLKSDQEKGEELLQELRCLIREDVQSGDEEFNVVVATLTTLLHNYKTLSPEVSKLGFQERCFYVVCQWVGHQFKEYKDEISHQVTEFKKRHIATIDSLPPAETVIQELFPQCMIVLLKAWMEDEVPTQGNQSQAWLPFPLVQLILEFANQTLVSGVAHVLYSRLIQADSV